MPFLYQVQFFWSKSNWEAPVTLALVMIPGAYVGGILGARLMRVLPVRVLKGIYAATMAAIAIKMLTSV